MQWTVLSDNRSSNAALETEHGLSILLRTEKHKILLDTGASDVFLRNAELLGMDLSDGTMFSFLMGIATMQAAYGTSWSRTDKPRSLFRPMP